MYSKAGKSYLQKQYMRVCSFIPSFYKYTSAGIMLKLKVFCRPPGKVTTSSTRGEFPETTPWEDAFSGGCTPTASEILHPPPANNCLPHCRAQLVLCYFTLLSQPVWLCTSALVPSKHLLLIQQRAHGKEISSAVKSIL